MFKIVSASALVLAAALGAERAASPVWASPVGAASVSTASGRAAPAYGRSAPRATVVQRSTMRGSGAYAGGRTDARIGGGAGQRGSAYGQAVRGYGYGHGAGDRRGYGYGYALGAGVAGLALGAELAGGYGSGYGGGYYSAPYAADYGDYYAAPSYGDQTPDGGYAVDSYPGPYDQSGGYGGQAYGAQAYPAQPYPAQAYPAQAYPAPAYPSQTYAAVPSPCASGPCSGYYSAPATAYTAYPPYTPPPQTYVYRAPCGCGY